MWSNLGAQKKVGTRLALLRTLAGLSQAELAGILKKPQSFVSNYERGQRRIDVLELVQLAEGLKLNPAKVYGYIVGFEPSTKKYRAKKVGPDPVRDRKWLSTKKWLLAH